jgi:SAM-dependent methyltransferase
MNHTSPNLDPHTVASFGDEWQRFDQQEIAPAESERVFDDYFAIFPWDQLPSNAEGFDMGCGSGRWARFVAPRVGRLHCIDPSSALAVARQALADQPNVQFHKASVAASGLPPNSQDFGYSLGVLHHVPNTAAAIRSCTELLKPGAPLLVYVYYAFENRPRWFHWLWQISNTARLVIRLLPPRPKQLITDLIALFVYWPLARFAALVEIVGFPVGSFPLSYYRSCSFYTMRTDARDRFGTPLEQRFTRAQIRQMCSAAGLVNLRFSQRAPFWCVVGLKAEI